MVKLSADPSAVHTQAPGLAGRNVIVTGGTTGIGRAIAALLATEGANVLIFGRQSQDLKAALDGLKTAPGKVTGLTADVTRAEEVRGVFEAVDREFGGLDVLVNNAGLNTGQITEGSDAEWRYDLQTLLGGYIDCTRHAVERLRQRGGGHIINIGSISAAHQNAGMSLYVAAKAAIHGYSQSLRKELGPENIKVSVIEPGMVGTGILDEEYADPQVQRQEQKRGAMLKPEDIAVAVHYCLTQPPRCNISLLRIEPRQDD
jgi:NAD(P)-dependent dehydrogenase (short-subunit alcohol dehydrogenase family)